MKPGKYIIVPATAKPGIEEMFYLSVYYNCDQKLFTMKRLKPENEKQFDFKAHGFSGGFSFDDI